VSGLDIFAWIVLVILVASIIEWSASDTHQFLSRR
jgi:hypothetical protein